MQGNGEKTSGTDPPPAAASGLRRTVRRIEIIEAQREIWFERTGEAEAGTGFCTQCGQAIRPTLGTERNKQLDDGQRTEIHKPASPASTAAEEKDSAAPA
jgi:hypothetical protein